MDIANSIRKKTSYSSLARRPGAGRKSIKETDPDIVADLERLVDPITRGDPESPFLQIRDGS